MPFTCDFKEAFGKDGDPEIESESRKFRSRGSIGREPKVTSQRPRGKGLWDKDYSFDFRLSTMFTCASFLRMANITNAANRSVNRNASMKLSA